MTKTALNPAWNAAKIPQGEIPFKGPLQLAAFTAGLFGSMALLLIALLLHV